MPPISGASLPTLCFQVQPLSRAQEKQMKHTIPLTTNCLPLCVRTSLLPAHALLKRLLILFEYTHWNCLAFYNYVAP